MRTVTELSGADVAVARHRPGLSDPPRRLPAASTESPKSLELERMARGWSRFLQLTERIRRQDAGEPLVQLARVDP